MLHSNFHTHSTYSDGRDVPRELIEAALACGFSSLGFSDHAPENTGDNTVMKLENERAYRTEIATLAAEYADRIKIYCGIELGSASTLPTDGYDFVIASKHHVVRGDKVYDIDNGAENQRLMANELFGGDMVKTAQIYFREDAEHVVRAKPDIVGHFDLAAKYSIVHENDREYLRAAFDALDVIMPVCRTFELNTGAIARGYRTIPYPAPAIMRELKIRGARMIVTSDCHDKNKLTAWFAEAEDYLASFGFKLDEHGDLNGKVRNIEIWE